MSASGRYFMIKWCIPSIFLIYFYLSESLVTSYILQNGTELVAFSLLVILVGGANNCKSNSGAQFYPINTMWELHPLLKTQMSCGSNAFWSICAMVGGEIGNGIFASSTIGLSRFWFVCNVSLGRRLCSLLLRDLHLNLMFTVYV